MDRDPRAPDRRSWCSSPTSCGSIPVGVLVARLAGGTDPRTIGSGRTGGTNALRALGRRWAAIVVAGDLLKGAVPVLFARGRDRRRPLVEVLCGAAAVAGAIWSVFVGFRSGRGVGTGVGTMLVIQPIAVLLAAPVFVVVILLTRYVSLGSLLASAAMFPAMLLVWAVASGTSAAVRRLRRGRRGPDLDGPRRQHRPAAPRHGAQVRPRAPGGQEAERLTALGAGTENSPPGRPSRRRERARERAHCEVRERPAE